MEQVNSQKSLMERELRRQLMVDGILELHAQEGIVTTRAQVEKAYDIVQMEKRLREKYEQFLSEN